MRTGNEPTTARSPLRMRFWLSIWGLAWAIFGTTIFAIVDRPGWAAVCGALGLVVLADLAFVIRHIRQGSRFQPGRDVPPWDPEDEPDPRRRDSEDPPKDGR